MVLNLQIRQTFACTDLSSNERKVSFLFSADLNFKIRKCTFGFGVPVFGVKSSLSVADLMVVVA
jgi:hypothetical protein